MRDDRPTDVNDGALEAFAERVAARLRAPESLEATFESRLMASVRAEAVARRLAEGRAAAARASATPTSRFWRWFVAPRMIPLSPALVAAGALVVVVGAGVWKSGVPGAEVLTATPPLRGASAAGGAEPHAAPQIVRFVLVAPSASTVSLVGDFNGWDPGSTLLRASGENGIWTVDVPLAPGRHLYAFLVDGERWMIDPAAPTAVEDDFGTPNSVVTVPEGAT